MSLEMNIKQQGTEEFQQVLKTLQKMGAKTYGVYLADRQRSDSNASNVDILEYLAKGGRDFASLGNDEGGVIQRGTDAMVAAIEAKTAAKQEIKADPIMTKMLIKIMKDHIKRNVMKRQQSGRDSTGGNLNKVSDDYAAWRSAKYGRSSDAVGIASGDLMDAIAALDIKVLRK